MPISLTITPLVVDLLVGEQIQLTVLPSPNGVKWSCSACNIASVTKQGLVTGLAEGTATITGKRGNVSVSITVNVTNVDPPDPPPPAPPILVLTAADGSSTDDLWLFLTEGTTAAAGDTIVGSTINFGDGTGTTTYPGAPPGSINKTWATPGTFSVVLTVTTALGQFGRKELPVEVLAPPVIPPDPPPQPLVHPDVTLAFISGQYVNQPVTFAVSGFDYDGTVVSHEINYGDGTIITAAGLPISPISHNYTAPGTYPVTVTMTDNDGLTGSASVTVTVVAQPTPNQPPIAVLVKTFGTYVGSTYTFSTVGSVDLDGTLTFWVFQSGAGVQQSGSGAPPPSLSALYPTAGFFVARLTLTDDDGDTKTVELNVIVSVLPQPGAFPYFDTTRARPDCFRSHAWRSQAEIDQFAGQVQNPKTIVYVYPNDPDPRGQDGAKMITPAMPPGGIPNGPITELITRMGPNLQKNIFIVGDFWWGAEWAFGQAGIAAHKGAPWAFCSPSESIWVGTRVSYKLAQQFPSNQPPGGPFVGFTWAQGTASEAIQTSLDVPSSPWWVGDMAGFPLVELPDNDIPHSRKYGEAVAPVVHNATFPGGTELGIVPERWTRFFAFFERVPQHDWICNRGLFAGQNKQMEAYRWYYWLADTVRDPILMIDGALVSPHPNAPNKWVGLKTEFQGGAGTPNVSPVPLLIYTRNWVILHGTPAAEVFGGNLLQKV